MTQTTRIRSTTIYILLSVCVLIAGIAATIWGGQDVQGAPDATGKPSLPVQRSPTWFAVGTSLLAAGLASLGFAVVRRFDDIDSVELHEKFDRMYEELRGSRTELRRARRVPDASERCLFDPEISGRFKQAVEDSAPDATVLVDVVGLKLNRFLNDQLEYLRNEARHRKVLVRMLVQDPDGEHFRAICRLETRDEHGTKDDILNTLTKLTGAKREGKDLVYENANLKILVRFFAQFQPIAFFRVGNTVLVRPRIRSSGAGARFYEAYDRREGESYSVSIATTLTHAGLHPSSEYPPPLPTDFITSFVPIKTSDGSKLAFTTEANERQSIWKVAFRAGKPVVLRRSHQWWSWRDGLTSCLGGPRQS